MGDETGTNAKGNRERRREDLLSLWGPSSSGDRRTDPFLLFSQVKRIVVSRDWGGKDT